MSERIEVRDYSRTLQAGRLAGRRHRWEEPRLHTWELMYTLSGRGRIILGEESFAISKGDMLLFSPATPRSYEPVGESLHWNLLWVHFEPPQDWENLLRWPGIRSGAARLSLPTPELRQKIFADLSEMLEVRNTQARYQERLSLNLLETALIRCQSVLPDASESSLEPRLRRALDLLSEAIAEPFNSARLACACGLSERQLFRSFQQHVGQSRRLYLEHCRLDRARQMLRETSLSVAEIAGQVGFDSPFYFSLRFRHLTGTSPTDYRKRLADGA
jgi:AraC family transcriptional regulator of arabinose operon